jgi:hypothetical protein
VLPSGPTPIAPPLRVNKIKRRKQYNMKKKKKEERLREGKKKIKNKKQT